jgi:hypothetical protein
MNRRTENYQPIESPEEFVRLLHGDSEDRQRAAWATMEMSVWQDLLKEDSDIRFAVAHNKVVPVEILAILAKDPESRVRSMVSVKHKLTPEILATMVDDPYDAIRMSVASHKNTPVEVLGKLTNDPWSKVADRAAERLSALRHTAADAPEQGAVSNDR